MSIAERINKLLENHPEWRHRKYRYRIIANLCNTDEETAKEVLSVERILREVIPADEVGIEKEKEWHSPKWLHEWEWDLKKEARITNNLTLWGEPAKKQ